MNEPIAFDSEEDLQRRLMMEAQNARRNAYAPYSGYRVGAAILGDDGRVYSGCNVENASFGLTICAERSAIFSAIGSGVKKIKAIAVVTKDAGAPCGACRQVIAEFAAPDLRVWVCGEKQVTQEYLFSELLPHAFGANAFSKRK